MVFLGELYAKHGWTMQLHLGVLRSSNTRLLSSLGPDMGFDSIGNFPQIATLGSIRTMRCRKRSSTTSIRRTTARSPRWPSNFQDGSGWWFLDQMEAMEWQLNAL